jgi:hypothetical protein
VSAAEKAVFSAFADAVEVKADVMSTPEQLVHLLQDVSQKSQLLPLKLSTSQSGCH